jgi:mRNA-degrading endonuclease RelE of RelBE toxin-antitoxin system
MPADLPFTIAHAENFPLELGRMPRNVQNTYFRTVLPALKAAPETSDPPRIKHLNGWKSLWRYRVRDNYRLVYRVDRSDHCVTMLMVDHRGKIYGRLGANPDGSPGIRIVATAEELLETAPTDVEVGNALISLAEEQLEEVIPSPEKQLPVNLNAQNLADWGVPEEHHAELQSANTEGELLALLGTVIFQPIPTLIVLGRG